MDCRNVLARISHVGYQCRYDLELDQLSKEAMHADRDDACLTNEVSKTFYGRHLNYFELWHLQKLGQGWHDIFRKYRIYALSL